MLSVELLGADRRQALRPRRAGLGLRGTSLDLLEPPSCHVDRLLGPLLALDQALLQLLELRCQRLLLGAPALELLLCRT